MSLIQINLNYSEAAQDLLSQTTPESNVEVAVICKLFRSYFSTTWAQYSSGNTVMWACGQQDVQETMAFPGVGSVRAKINGVYIYSCYAPPSAILAQCEEMLDGLVLDVRDHILKIIAGDFSESSRVKYRG